jgi:hypothetical protein
MLYYVKNGFELHLMILTHFSIGFDDGDQDEEDVDCVQYTLNAINTQSFEFSCLLKIGNIQPLFKKVINLI